MTVRLHGAHFWVGGFAVLVASSCHDFGGHASYKASSTGSEAGATGVAGHGGAPSSGNASAGSGDPDIPSEGGSVTLSGGTGSAEAGSEGNGTHQGGTQSGPGGEGGVPTEGAGARPHDDPPWPVPDFCTADEPIVPICYIGLGTTPAAPLANPRHVAMNTINKWGGFHLIVSERGGHTIRITWGDDINQIDWRCFDTVPYANHLAGTTMTNDFSEWFATTDCGAVFARRLVPYQGSTVWSPWAPFSLPAPGSFVLDIAASLAADGTNYVFVVDRGRVFQRHRVGTEAASFSPWAEVEAPQSTQLAAGLRLDGRQQLFLLDERGEPFTCIQKSSKLGAAFAGCVDFDGAAVPELIHVTAPYRVESGSPLLALDVEGAMWSRFQNDAGGFEPWQPFPVPPPEPLVSIAGGGILNWTGAPLRVAGITRGGNVYVITRRDGAWGTWSLLPSG